MNISFVHSKYQFLCEYTVLNFFIKFYLPVPIPKFDFCDLKKRNKPGMDDDDLQMINKEHHAAGSI